MNMWKHLTETPNVNRISVLDLPKKLDAVIVSKRRGWKKKENVNKNNRFSPISQKYFLLTLNKTYSCVFPKIWQSRCSKVNRTNMHRRWDRETHSRVRAGRISHPCTSPCIQVTSFDALFDEALVVGRQQPNYKVRQIRNRGLGCGLYRNKRLSEWSCWKLRYPVNKTHFGLWVWSWWKRRIPLNKTHFAGGDLTENEDSQRNGVYMIIVATCFS